MNHISDYNLERYHLGMVTDEAELAALEEHYHGCPECAKRRGGIGSVSEWDKGCNHHSGYRSKNKSASTVAGAASEFHSCFISHSTKDHEFAGSLRADLQAKGVRCWFAPEDLKIGDKFRMRIDEFIPQDFPHLPWKFIGIYQRKRGPFPRPL